MNQKEFEEIFDYVVRNSSSVLVEKAREYASDGDRMHNFKIAAELVAVAGGGTPEQALWGFLIKHLISVRDMVASGKEYPQGMWDEKIGDAINYFFLLRALIVDTGRIQAEEKTIDLVDNHSEFIIEGRQMSSYQPTSGVNEIVRD